VLSIWRGFSLCGLRRKGSLFTHLGKRSYRPPSFPLAFQLMKVIHCVQRRKAVLVAVDPVGIIYIQPLYLVDEEFFRDVTSSKLSIRKSHKESD
jgi:hypothetical protein